MQTKGFTDSIKRFPPFLPIVVIFIAFLTSHPSPVFPVDVGSSITFSSDNADGLNFTADVQATIDDGVTINTANNAAGITTPADEQGMIRFLGDGTVRGTTGTPALKLNDIFIDGALSTNVAFQNNVYADYLRFNGDGTMTITPSVAAPDNKIRFDSVSSAGNKGKLVIGDGTGIVDVTFELKDQSDLGFGDDADPVANPDRYLRELQVNHNASVYFSSSDDDGGTTDDNSNMYVTTLRLTLCGGADGCAFQRIKKLRADTIILENGMAFNDRSTEEGTVYYGDFTTNVDGTGSIVFGNAGGGDGEGRIVGNIGAPDDDGNPLRLNFIRIEDVVTDPKIQGDVYLAGVPGIQFAFDKTLTLQDGSDLYAHATSVAGNQGTLKFEGTNIIGTATDNFSLGTNANRLKGVFFANSTTAGTVTIYDNVYTATAANGGTSINIGGIAGGDDDLAIAGEQEYTGTLQIGKDLTFVGESVRVDRSSALDLQNHTLTVTGAYIHDANTSLKSAINGTAAGQYGRVVSSDNATIDADTQVDVTVNTYIPNNTSFTIVDGTEAGAGVQVLTDTITDNSFLVSFSQNIADNNNLVITASRTTMHSLIPEGRTAVIAQALDAAESTGQLQAAIYTLEILGSVKAIEDSLETLNPNDSAAITDASSAIMHHSLTAISNRLASTRGTGISSGSWFKEQSLWGSAFASFGQQDQRKDVAGYRLLTGGTAFGLDTNVTENTTLGGAWTYAGSNVKYDAPDLVETDISSNLLSFYADYEYETFFINTAYSFGWHRYKSTRKISFGSYYENPQGEYDGYQNTLFVESGLNLHSDDINITPFLSGNFTHLAIDSYTETGSTFNLQVDDQSYSVFETGLGIRLSKMFERFDYRVIPEIHFIWYHDWVADQVETKSSFAASPSTSFETKGLKPAADRFNLGSYVTFEYLNHMDLILAYDLELKNKYYGHNGAIKLRYKF